MTTVIVVAVVIIALALITFGIAVVSAASKRNRLAAKQAIREAKTRTDCFQTYVTDNLYRTSRVQHGTSVGYTASKKVSPVKRKREDSAYSGDDAGMYEAPTFGYIDSPSSTGYDSSSSSGDF